MIICFFDDTNSVLTAFELDKKYGAINESRKIILEPQYLYIGFTGNRVLYSANSYFEGSGVINKEGETLIAEQSNYSIFYPLDESDEESNYLARLDKNAEAMGIGSENSGAIIDKDGNIIKVLPVKIPVLKSGIYEGTIWVVDATDDSKGEYGYIDAEGNIFIEPIYQADSILYSDGYAIAEDDMKKHIIINKNGENVFGRSFDYVQQEQGKSIWRDTTYD